MKKKKLDISKIKNVDDLFNAKYGKIGTEKRNEFEENAQKYFISEMLKAARKEAKLTQSELAEKIGTKKSYISKLENGKVNFTIETLIKIFESGLNKKVSITIS